MPPSPQLAARVEAVRRHFGESCFACGRHNPLGLQLQGFDLVDGEVHAAFTPRPEYGGAGDTLHGGIAATALDEVLVWAGIVCEDVLTVTGTLELRYRRPIRIGGELRLRGRVDERRGRRLRCSGELWVEGEAAVTASGLYLVSHPIDELLSAG